MTLTDRLAEALRQMIGYPSFKECTCADCSRFRALLAQYDRERDKGEGEGERKEEAK